MTDTIRRTFLERQYEVGAELAANSDVVTVHPMPDSVGPPTRYVAQFKCTSIVGRADGQIGPADGEFIVGITFREDHLRFVDPLRVVTWLGPTNIVLPNVRPPFTCLGRIFPGVELIDLLYSVHEIICGLNWAADDALNEEAAEWTRRHQHLLPTDLRPLRRRAHGSAKQRGGA